MAIPFKMVTLQFDDGLLGVFTKAASIMHKAGALGTLAIATDFIDDTRETTMTKEQVVTLKNLGWDIQDHTKQHTRLTQLSDEKIVSELESVNKWFDRLGWDTPEHFYIPFRDIDSRVEDIVRRYRKHIINLASNVEVLPDLDTLGINYASRRGDTQDDEKQSYIKQTIDELDEGVYDWVIIRGHDVRDAPTSYQYCYYTHYFEDMVNYIASKPDIKFVTVEQGLRLQKSWKEAGII